jgi:FkbM family methyltransferase
MLTLLRKVRVALTPGTALLKTTLSNGAVVYGRNRAGFGGRGIYVYRDAIEPELEHLTALLDAPGVFVDVGASTGIYSLKAARHFANQGVVLALEPFPEVFATLHHSVQANGFSNVRLRNLCAGRETGVRHFWLNEGRPHSFSLLKSDQSAATMLVLTVALDDLLRWEGLDRLDYLKIDAEGAEEEILAGAREVIETCRPIVQIETSIRETKLSWAGYVGFRAPGSRNKVCIPQDHPKISVPERLGWCAVR